MAASNEVGISIERARRYVPGSRRRGVHEGYMHASLFLLAMSVSSVLVIMA
jgi:hypothetical protein